MNTSEIQYKICISNNFYTTGAVVALYEPDFKGTRIHGIPLLEVLHAAAPSTEWDGSWLSSPIQVDSLTGAEVIYYIFDE